MRTWTRDCLVRGSKACREDNISEKAKEILLGKSETRGESKQNVNIYNIERSALKTTNDTYYSCYGVRLSVCV